MPANKKRFFLLLALLIVLNISTYSQFYAEPLRDILLTDESNKLPKELDPTINWLKYKLRTVFYSDLQYSGSTSGNSASHSFVVVPAIKKEFALPDSGIKLLLVPDDTTKKKGAIINAVTNNDILSFQHSFDINNFKFTPYDYYITAIKAYRISEEEMVTNCFMRMIYPSSDGKDKRSIRQIFLDDINSKHKGLNLAAKKTEKLDTVNLFRLVKEKTDKPLTLLAYETFVASDNLEDEWTNLSRLMNRLSGGSIKDAIDKDLEIKTAFACSRAKLLMNFSSAVAVPVIDTPNKKQEKETTVNFEINKTTVSIENEGDSGFVYKIVFEGQFNTSIDWLKGVRLDNTIWGEKNPRIMRQGYRFDKLILSFYKNRYKFEVMNDQYDKLLLLYNNTTYAIKE